MNLALLGPLCSQKVLKLFDVCVQRLARQTFVRELDVELFLLIDLGSESS